MKFGRTFKEHKLNFPSVWTDSSLDYDALKKYLKVELEPSSLNPSLPSQSAILIMSSGNATPMDADSAGSSFSRDASCSSLAGLLDSRLSTMQLRVPEFLRLLGVGVDKLNGMYVEQAEIMRLLYQTISAETADNMEAFRQLFKEIVKLERFILLNFTGICKILKKHDKITGIRLSEVVLSRISTLDFYRSTGLLELKQKLLDRISGGGSAAARTSSTEALMSPIVASVPPNGSHLSNHPSQWFPPAASLASQKIIVSMSGPHGTDIIGALIKNLAAFDIAIEDLMFSRLYHNVTCAALIRLSAPSSRLFRDLATSANQWEAELKFDVYDETDKLPRSLQDAPYFNRHKYTATAVNPTGLSAKFLNEWTQLLLSYKISVESMKRLNEGQLCVLDMRLSVPIEVDFDKFRADLFQLSSQMGTDIALQPDNIYRRNKRLVIMDMDSTLIQQEVIDELAKYAGVVDEVKSITHRAMNGEIDFKESLKCRVGLLSNSPVTILEQVRRNLVFTEGAHALCKALKKLGYKLAVISGGFLPLALYVKNELGLDYAFANQLKVSPDGQTLVGETVGPVVDAERKAELLEVIAQAEGISTEQVIAIGDGANDLFMLAAAGLGIAFNAKPKVQEKARTRINQKSLENVLYLLGHSDDEIKELKA
eukprot:Partr_v1_DN27200_c2_g1_i1_m16054 putative phosphoserine phosphatase